MNKIIYITMLVFLLMHNIHSAEWVEENLNSLISYSHVYIEVYQEEENVFVTPSHPPSKGKTQAEMHYRGNPKTSCYERMMTPGKDGRRQVTRTDIWPDSIHGQMLFSFDGNDEYGGSGVMVGPHHFLTAGHCVYDHITSRWASSIKIHMGLNGEIAPFNVVNATKIYTYKKWVESQNSEFDIALVILDYSIGYETGWASLMYLPCQKLSDKIVHVTGYPGDKDKQFKQMWSMDGTLAEINDEKFSYKIDTYGGQSGGAVWIRQFGTPYVLGVHTRAGDGQNFGVRLSHNKIETIVRNWLANTWEILGDAKLSGNGTSNQPSYTGDDKPSGNGTSNQPSYTGDDKPSGNGTSDQANIIETRKWCESGPMRRLAEMNQALGYEDDYYTHPRQYINYVSNGHKNGTTLVIRNLTPYTLRQRSFKMSSGCYNFHRDIEGIEENRSYRYHLRPSENDEELIDALKIINSSIINGEHNIISKHILIGTPDAETSPPEIIPPMTTTVLSVKHAASAGPFGDIVYVDNTGQWGVAFNFAKSRNGKKIRMVSELSPSAYRYVDEPLYERQGYLSELNLNWGDFRITPQTIFVRSHAR